MRFFRKKNKRKLIVSLLLVTAFLGVGFFVTHQQNHVAFAAESASQEESGITVGTILDQMVSSNIEFFNELLNGILTILGWLSSVAVTALGAIASFRNFNNTSVQDAWSIVRDIVNSFYIVVLIAIAISTIIRFQNFDFRQTLPKLLLSAVLVNFSLTICMLAVNFSTSVMQTFVVGIQNGWPGLLLGLRLPATIASETEAFGQSGADTTATWEEGTIMVTLLLAIVTMSVAIFAIMAYVIILMARIVMIWMLLILSPLAFFLWGTPGRATSYWSQWYDEFVKALISGPVLVFFLYVDILFFVRNTQDNYGLEGISDANIQRGGLTEISDPKVFISYIIGLVFLFVGLEVANQLNARGTAFAKSFSKKALTKPLKGLGRATKGLGRATKGTLKKADQYRFSQGKTSVAGAVEAAKTWGKQFSSEELLKRGKEKRLQQLDPNARGLKAYGQALTAGELGLAQKMRGEKGGFGRAAKDVKEWWTGKSEEAQLEEEKNEIGKRETVRTFLSTLEGNARENVAKAGSVSGLHRNAEAARERKKMAESQISDLQTQLSQAQEYRELKQRDRSGVLDPDAQRRKEELEDQFGTDADPRALISERQNKLDQARRDYGQSDEQQKFFESAASVFEGQGIEGDYSEYVDVSKEDTKDDIDKKAAADKEQKKEIQQKLKPFQREKKAILSAKRAEMRKKGKEYEDNTYEKDVRHDAEYIASNARDNLDRGNMAALTKDVLKSAEQGEFKKVAEEIVPEFTMDAAGLEKFKGEMKKKGMHNEEVGDLMDRVQSRLSKDNLALQSNMVKTDETGSYKVMDDTARKEAIKKQIDKKLKDHIKRGVGAIAEKDKSGKIVINDVAKEVLQKNKNNIKKMFKDERFATEVSNEVKKAIRDAFPDMEDTLESFIDE